MASHHPSSLRLAEFSDRELMNIILDIEDEDGCVTSLSMADAIGIKNDRPHVCVGIRLSWMRHYGVVDRLDDGRWHLTDIGRKLALGQLTASQKKALGDMAPDKLMEATALLSQRYRNNPAPVANMMRRAWSHGTGRR